MRRVLAVLAALAAVGAGGYAYLQHTEPGWWVRLWYPLSYERTVTGYARIYKLDPALVAAVIYEESRFRPDARSDAGAVGLMQLLPSTARGIALHTGGHNFKGVSDLLNPDINVRYGCWYLRHLRLKYARYSNGANLALAAYNAGQANVDGWISQTPAGSPVRIRFKVTRDYIAEVNHVRDLYRRAYAPELGYG